MENEDRVKKILNILGFPKSDAQVMEVRSLSKLLDEKDAEIAKLEALVAKYQSALRQIVSFHKIQRERYVDSQEPHNMMEIAKQALEDTPKEEK